MEILYFQIIIPHPADNEIEPDLRKAADTFFDNRGNPDPKLCSFLVGGRQGCRGNWPGRSLQGPLAAIRKGVLARGPDLPLRRRLSFLSRP